MHLEWHERAEMERLSQSTQVPSRRTDVPPGQSLRVPLRDVCSYCLGGEAASLTKAEIQARNHVMYRRPLGSGDFLRSTKQVARRRRIDHNNRH